MKDKFFELKIQSSHIDTITDLLFDFGVTCTQEADGVLFLRDEDDLSNIEWGVLEFCKKSGFEVKTTLGIKDNKDWIDEYKKSVKPVLAGKFYIRPSWEPSSSGLIDIIIDPALAFGSGHHESTNSCLHMISKYFNDAGGLQALDVGCGSGILSIAMAKLGFSVNACDTDELAVCSTNENAGKNGVKLQKIWVGSVTDNSDKFDLVTSNIIADVILLLQKELKNSVKVGGHLILSGILSKYKEAVMSSFSDFQLLENITINEWESFIFINKGKNGK